MGEGPLGDESVESIELMLRKVARGDVPNEGDVLLRANRGWVFGSPILDTGALDFRGGGGNKIVTGTGVVKILGDTVPPSGTDNLIYEDVLELGAGSYIEEDLPNGELIARASGLFTINALIAYTSLGQASKFSIVASHADPSEGDIIIASSDVDAPNPGATAVSSVGTRLLLEPGDSVYAAFGRANEAGYNAEAVRVYLIMTLSALRRG